MTAWNREVIGRLMVECGRIALRWYRQPRARLKADRTIVTEADHEIEAHLAAALDRPQEGSYLIGEETVAGKDEAYVTRALAGRAWIVDPIDGTAPYARRIPTWGVSVALAVGGRLQEGAIYLPVTDELFTTDGGRVFYGNPGVEAEEEVTGAVDHRAPLDPSGVIAITQEMAKRGRLEMPNQVQALGVAVLPLAYLALGRYEGYIGRLKLWDCAAGLALLAACGFPVKLPSIGYLDGRIDRDFWRLDAADPDRWQARDLLVSARNRDLVETICAASFLPGE